MKGLLSLLITLSVSLVHALEIRKSFEKTQEQCEEIINEYTPDQNFQRCGAVTYYLVGSCEAAALEIKKLDTKQTPVCECKQSSCETILNPHLTAKMQSLLKNPHPRDDMLNCYNTLLHSLGFELGFHQDVESAHLLISSPYCQRHDGRPNTGDVIWASGHGYFALTDSIAFNKSAPGNDMPYEVIFIDDYFKQQGDDLKCQFISFESARSQGCATNSSAYRCDLPSSLKTNESLGHTGKLLLEMYNDCSYRESVLGEKTETNLEELVGTITELGRKTLKVPTAEETDPSLVDSFKQAYLRSIPVEYRDQTNVDYFDRNVDRFVEEYYLMSAPDMKTDNLNPEIRHAIELARAKKFYPSNVLEERIGWSIVLLGHTNSYLDRISPEDPE